MIKVPTPAAGKVRVEKVTIKATTTPKLTVTNLAALGSGFHGVAGVGKSKTAGKYVVYLVMFNSSSSSAGTLNLNVPNGTPAGPPLDESKICRDLQELELQQTLRTLKFQALKKGDSPPPTEFKNDVTYLAKSCS